MGFEQLQGYKPEVPKEGNEPFAYEGPVVIEKSVIGVNTRESTDFYPAGCNMISIEAIVMSGENSGRKLFKKFNLDSVEEDKKGKTPLRKLADQFWAAGLSFNNSDELSAANEKLIGMALHVKAWEAKFSDGKTNQMWNIKGLAHKGGGSTKPAF